MNLTTSRISTLGPVRRKRLDPLKIWIAVCAAVAILLGLIVSARRPGGSGETSDAAGYVEVPKAQRELPAEFPLGTHLPPYRETRASGAVDPGSFSPERDLIRFDDKRVWWESDHDSGSEDDHMVHRALAEPLQKLISAVYRLGGTLKVQDSYRPTGAHARRSLHKEGRAIDLTCTGMSLETLAKLCWLAGFDWVYHEAHGGHHVHCSVRTPGRAN